MIETVLAGTGSSSSLWIDVLEPTPEELGRISEEYGIPRSALDDKRTLIGVCEAVLLELRQSLMERSFTARR